MYGIYICIVVGFVWCMIFLCCKDYDFNLLMLFKGLCFMYIKRGNEISVCICMILEILFEVFLNRIDI